MTDSTLVAGLDRSSTTVRPGRRGERKQTGTPRGGKLGRQATGLCGASHDIVSHRIALHSMTLHCTTLPYVASPRFASRQGTSHPGMSGVSRPADVANAVPASNQGRPSGFSNGRLHLRWLWISQTCRCFRSQERASAVPSAGRCAGRQAIGPSSQAAPHCRSRSVGGAWEAGAPGVAAGLPRTSVPVRWAVRGEGGLRVELAACPRCCLCRCHAGHFGALQKPEL